jgi:hypothetical protein
MLSKIITASVMFIAATALVAGCQDSKPVPATSADTAAVAKAIACEKCQITYVQSPIDAGKGKIVGYSTHKEMECWDCRSVAENFFAAGKMKHTCASCDSTMQTCEAH